MAETKMHDHYILCGAGRTGIHIAKQFSENCLPFMLIEQDADLIEALSHKMECQDFHFLEGDATEDELLESAGIHRAKGLITTLGDDKDNAFVVLTARSLNPNLFIVARVTEEDDNIEKLHKAGANTIVSTNKVGGLRLASEMIRPEVTKFLDLMAYTARKDRQLRFTEMRIDEFHAPALQGRDQLTIADIGQNADLLVVAIKHEGQYRYKPRGDTVLYRRTSDHSGDILVVVGTQEELDRARGIDP